MNDARPSHGEIETRFVAVLDGSQSRDEVDRWASEVMRELDDVEVDGAVWSALLVLSGVDLRHGSDEPYLHDDEQIRGWLTEFRNHTGHVT